MKGHARRYPDGACACGDDVDALVAFACARCRELPWADCERCGAGAVAETLGFHASVEGPICHECQDDFCDVCGLDGYCRCCEADRAYDAWKDDGVRS